MELFDFDYHVPQTKYPESGNRMQLGGSYVFATQPEWPNQRIITLNFASMRAFDKVIEDPENEGEFITVPDPDKNPKINVWRLELFYQRHELWKPFEYLHPAYRKLVVNFNKPFESPRIGQNGFADSFTIELLELP